MTPLLQTFYSAVHGQVVELWGQELVIGLIYLPCEMCLLATWAGFLSHIVWLLSCQHEDSSYTFDCLVGGGVHGLKVTSFFRVGRISTLYPTLMLYYLVNI